MSVHAVSIERCGLVTSVGLTSACSCAAFRAKLANPIETRFIDSSGVRLIAHQVELEQPWQGLVKLARMAALAIEEAIEGVSVDDRAGLPVLLCVAETGRPGRTLGLDDELTRRVEAQLGFEFGPGSSVIPQGRVSVAIAIAQARVLLESLQVPAVVVAACDGLLSWPTLGHYDQAGRLLRDGNSDGFIPGEGAGALLIGRPTGRPHEMLCTGIGLGHETAFIDSGTPLRADGLSSAIKGALAEARLQTHDIAFRITDNSGEQYYFKEAALALSRTLHKRKHALDLWHPAECIGEVGAAVGTAIVALAKAACDKGFGRGDNILVHLSNDEGGRAAMTLQYRGVP